MCTASLYTAQYSTLLYSTLLYSTLLYSTLPPTSLTYPPLFFHAVFDVVYPGLADLLARAGGIPQLSLILSTQMARLAIASLSFHTPSPGSTGSQGQGHGQGGAGNGYWELVVECLCSSYSRTVSRMKDLPVEQELVKSTTSVSTVLYRHTHVTFYPVLSSLISSYPILCTTHTFILPVARCITVSLQR